MPKPDTETAAILAAHANNGADSVLPPAAETVGSRLQRERVAQNLSAKDAANALHLMKSDLRAIENDNYTALPHDESLRSYLRDYAKLLRLDIDSILALYDRQAGTNMHRGVHRVASIPSVYPSRSGRWLTGSLVAATLVLGILVLFKFSDGDAVTERFAEKTPSAQPVVQQNSMPQSLDTGISGAIDENGRMTLAKDEDPADSMPPPGQRASSNSISPTPAPAQDPIEQVADTNNTPRDIPAEPKNNAVTLKPVATHSASLSGRVAKIETPDVKAVEPLAAIRGADNNSGSANGAGPEDKLTFQFTKDCWVEVYDAHGKRLVAGIEKAGETLELSGTSPFRILVGYSREVTLQFNGHGVEIEKIDRSFSTLFSVARAPAADDVSAQGPLVTTIRRD